MDSPVSIQISQPLPSKGFPTFTLSSPRFNQKTFWGRYRHFLDIIDVRTIFHSQKKIKESIQLLEDFKNNTLPPNVSTKHLWKAKKIVDSMIHPDTGQKIFLPFRFSSFVPLNIPIIIGMTTSSTHWMSVTFWQWINQSYNVFVNFYNRNISNNVSSRDLLKGYIAASTTAVSMAVGLGWLVKTSSSFSPVIKTIIQIFVPFIASSLAGTANVVVMRNNEFFKGVKVFDKEGNDRGTSHIAARKVLFQVGLSRFVLPFPLLIFPPFIMKFLNKTQFLLRNPRLYFPIHLGVIVSAITLALPACIGLLPQCCTFKSSSLEPAFHNLYYPNGQPVNEFYCNKGL